MEPRPLVSLLVLTINACASPGSPTEIGRSVENFVCLHSRPRLSCQLRVVSTPPSCHSHPLFLHEHYVHPVRAELGLQALFLGSPSAAPKAGKRKYHPETTTELLEN